MNADSIVTWTLSIAVGLVILIPSFAWTIRAGRNKRLKNKIKEN